MEHFPDHQIARNLERMHSADLLVSIIIIEMTWKLRFSHSHNMSSVAIFKLLKNKCRSIRCQRNKKQRFFLFCSVEHTHIHIVKTHDRIANQDEFGMICKWLPFASKISPENIRLSVGCILNKGKETIISLDGNFGVLSASFFTTFIVKHDYNLGARACSTAKFTEQITINAE